MTALQGDLTPCRRHLQELLDLGARGRDKQAARLCTGLLERYDALWTFTRVAGVPATNNTAAFIPTSPTRSPPINTGNQSQPHFRPDPRSDPVNGYPTVARIWSNGEYGESMNVSWYRWCPMTIFLTGQNVGLGATEHE